VYDPRVPNPTTSQSKNAKASPNKEFQTIQQANPKIPRLCTIQESQIREHLNPKLQGFTIQRIPNHTTSQSKLAKPCTIQDSQIQQQVNPRMTRLPQSKNSKPYNKTIQKCLTLHNPRTPNPTTSQSKNAKASPIKELKTIQQANPKCQTLQNPRIPSPRTSQSKIAKASPIKPNQTIQQTNPKIPTFSQSKNPKTHNK
jgi:hypothetical protein